jgi:hypothetical protein
VGGDEEMTQERFQHILDDKKQFREEYMKDLVEYTKKLYDENQKLKAKEEPGFKDKILELFPDTWGVEAFGYILGLMAAFVAMSGLGLLIWYAYSTSMWPKPEPSPVLGGYYLATSIDLIKGTQVECTYIYREVSGKGNDFKVSPCKENFEEAAKMMKWLNSDESQVHIESLGEHNKQLSEE